MRLGDIPDFGNLSDVKVLFTGHTVAVPFAAELLAEQGAKCICMENPRSPDSARRGPRPYGFLAEHRNELSINLDLSSPLGKEAFFKIIGEIDIFIEGFRPGFYGQGDFSDSALWDVNPRLAIVHVSGYGQTGDADYVGRTSFDGIAQAFSGYMIQNGLRGGDPLRAAPYTADYVCALFAVFGALTAYVGAQRKGEGESVDVSQFESMLKIQYRVPMAYFLEGDLMERWGNAERDYLGLDLFKCMDGASVFVCVCALGPVARLIDVLGIGDSPLVSGAGPIHTLFRDDPVSEYINAKLTAFCLEHTAEEVNRIFNREGIPCSFVNDMRTLAADPHVKERECFIEWDDARFGRLKGVGIIPKMSRNPGRIWDGAHDFGQDNRDVMREAGITDVQLEALHEQGICIDGDSSGGYDVECLNRKVPDGFVD